MKQAGTLLLIGALALASIDRATAFSSNGRWDPTATDGPTGPPGTSATVTWSLVADGTFIPGEGPSNLIFFLDSLFGSGPGGRDYKMRPWFRFFDDSFGRWAELSGLAFVYEPADDGVDLRGLWGALAERGDIRIGGAFLDGNAGILASTGFLNDADITIDTGDAAYYSNSAPGGAFRNIHNTLMHEIGHASGLGHIESSTSDFLMEPVTNTTIDGPQLDDIRGIQSLYGDSLEKDGGNNVPATATNLGLIAAGTGRLQGEHAATGTSILMSETDFLSIAHSGDDDFFSFQIAQPAVMNLVVTPLGPTYNERANSADSFTTTTSASLSNLSLELFSSGSTSLMASSTSNPVGQPESILDFTLLNPGEYVFRVFGSSALTQMYRFSLTIEALGVGQPGDFNPDGEVDGRDFLAWQRGHSPDPLSASDLAVWQLNFGTTGQLTAGGSVPEPTGLVLLWVAAIAIPRLRQVLSFDFGKQKRPGDRHPLGVR